jgi:hypothetical protein
VLLILGLAGCSPVVVHEEDLPPVAVISVACLGCQSLHTGFAPLTVTLTSQSTDDHGVVATFWELGSGLTSTQPSVVQTYTQPGTYTIKLTVADAKGQLAHAQVILRILEKPIEYKTDRGENEYFIMERILPDRAFAVGETITIKLRITPKRNLEYSFWQEILPPELQPNYSRLEFHGFQLKAQTPVAWVYEVTIEEAGHYQILGRGQAVDGPNSEDLRLTTSLESTDTQP